MEYLDLIVLSLIVSLLFGVFIFGPMAHAQSSKTSKKSTDKND
jgi:hypothetical protein